MTGEIGCCGYPLIIEARQEKTAQRWTTVETLYKSLFTSCDLRAGCFEVVLWKDLCGGDDILLSLRRERVLTLYLVFIGARARMFAD
jgi:hypothetical protein